MKNIGKISIILPCYKAERYVGDMISDILAQTYNDWQLIVVSNGEGQEAQLKVINAYAEKDNRIEVVTAEHGGVSNARNIGITKVKGEWLTFVDADDRCDNNHLELLASGADNKTDMVIAGYTQTLTKYNTHIRYEIEPNHRLDKYVMAIPCGCLHSLWCKLLNVNKLQNWGVNSTLPSPILKMRCSAQVSFCFRAG